MGPYVTGFFLVFAGMLIGYFLWYRDRSEERSLRMSLARENEDLRASLKLAHSSHEKLDERFIRQKGQLNVLQQLCDDWSSSREQLEKERAQLEVDAADKTRRFEEAAAELQQEKNRRIELEDKNHSLTQDQIGALSRVEDSWRIKFSRIESSLFQRQADLKSTSNENERLTKQLHTSEARIAELQSDLASQKSLLETATANASGLKQEYVTVESALEENAEVLKQTSAECAAALSAQRVAEESLVALQKDYEVAQSQIEDLQNKLAVIDSLESQVTSLEETLTNSADQLAKVSEQRDKALEAENSALNRAAGMQQRISNQEATIHGLREKRDHAFQNLQVELQKRNEIELAFEQKTRELESLITEKSAQLQNKTVEFEQQAGDINSRLEKERDQWQNRISSQSRELTELAQNRDQLSTELLETQQSLANAKHELSASMEQSEALATEIGKLKETCQRIGELEQLVKQRDAQESLISEELSALRTQYADAYRSQQELQAELERACQEREQLTSNFGQYEDQIRILQSKLSASEETIRTLRRERAGVLARLANYRTIAEPDATVISFTEAMAQRAQQSMTYDKEYGGHTSQHETRGLVYTEAPESRDDLKRISGIAEVLEGRLNDYGIYTFRQIMEWKPQAIEEFSRLLAFRDRIERDEWLAQARFFYEEKQKMTRRVAA